MLQTIEVLCYVDMVTVILINKHGLERLFFSKTCSFKCNLAVDNYIHCYCIISVLCLS